MRTCTKVWLTALAICLSINVASAQLYSGSITGVISDPSNAMIPGAQVTVEDQAKGFVFHVVTDNSGRYLLRSVPPSTYKMTVNAQGFQIQTRTGIEISVGDNETVNFSLPVSTSTEAITITGEATLLATEDAATGQVLNRQFMNDLPVLGRNTMALSYLTSGLVSAYESNQQTGQGANDFSVNGGRAWTNDVLIDGVSSTNYEQNGGLLVMSALPSPDAIEEFKVQTSNFSAEFGFTGATVVNMVMRSGTNAFHGSAYEYLRNSKLDSNNFFNNMAGKTIAPLRRNNFGGTVSGPIQRNKTFFFFDYDGLRQRSMTTTTFGVPSAAERTGNFAEVCGYQGGTFDSAGKCSKAAGQLWDPYSGVYSASAGGAVRSAYIPFNNLATYMSPGNPNLNGTGYQLAAKVGNLISPVAAKEIAYMPLPNLNVGTGSYQYYNNFLASGSAPRMFDDWDVKVDHRFSEATLLSGKFTRQLQNHQNLNAFGNESDTINNGLDDNHLYLAGMNINHTFSPTLLLTASYGFNRWWEYEAGHMGNYPGVDPVGTLGLPSYMKAAGVDQFPAVTAGSPYSSGSAGISVGTQGSAIIRRGQDTHQGLATLSWVKGSHELKVGGEIRMHRINWYSPANPGGTFSFGFSQTAQTSSGSSTGGDAWASALIGWPGSGSYQINGAFSTQNFQWGGFVQDNWKALRNLTINFGFRYDVTVPRTERYNRMYTLDPTITSQFQVAGVPTLHGAEIFATPNNRTPYQTYFGDLQPRIGFAWQARPKMVVRGGYGIYFEPSISSVTGGGVGGGAWSRSTSEITTLNSDGATPWGRIDDMFPGTGPLLPLGSSLGMLNDIGFSPNGTIPSKNANPYEQSWSLDIQREFPGHILVDAGYTGKKGTHLYFGGNTSLDYLGPQYAQYSAAQITALNTMIANPFYGQITNTTSSLAGPTIAAYRLQTPYPQYTGFAGDAPPWGNSLYQGLQMRVEKKFSAGLQLLVTYVFSKALDDASVSSNSWNTGGSSLQDPNNRRLEYSVSLYDMTHVLQISHVYQLPFGRGRKLGNDWNPVLNAFFGGWGINGIWSFDSGRPLSPGLNGGQSIPTYGSQRPNLVCTPSRNTGSNWMSQYFADSACFSKPTPYAIGTAPRTLPWVRTPGMRNANVSVSKEFPLSIIREGMRLQYILQTLNFFNHPQFGGPGMSFGSASFGTVTSQTNTPRDIEMALKLTF